MGDMALEDGIAVVEHLIDDIGRTSLFSSLERVAGIGDEGTIGAPIALGGLGFEDHGILSKLIDVSPLYHCGSAGVKTLDGLGEYLPGGLGLVVVLEVVAKEFALVLDLVGHQSLDEAPCLIFTQRHLCFHDRWEDGLHPFERGIGLPCGIVEDYPDALLAAVLRDIAAEGDPFADDGDLSLWSLFWRFLVMRGSSVVSFLVLIVRELSGANSSPASDALIRPLPETV